MSSLLWEIQSKGRIGTKLPDSDVPEYEMEGYLPDGMMRVSDNGLPCVAEHQVVRHFVEISSQNHHVDKGFYPLGSCTMKYNPKLSERLAGLSGFTKLHPLTPTQYIQGALKLMAHLGELLCKIGGMDDITMQPAAGAQGEFTGLMIIREYHRAQGNPRKKVIIPDSSHGTNPASIVFSGWKPVEIKSDSSGKIDLEALKPHLDEDLAALMVTNPNTLGIFESDIKKVAEMLHSVDAQLYMDGANMNALLGIARPGDFGVDAIHYNLHKTFSTPHGGGGPGSGPVAVKEHLRPFLPEPKITFQNGKYSFQTDNKDSIGKLQAFWGAFAVMVKAYAYILTVGADGLKKISQDAVINSNYLCSILSEHYELTYNETPMHEFVLSGEFLKEYGVKTLDVAKRLLDYGFHAPTIYFPLIVHEALMIEPTETETKETLDAFAKAMIEIKQEAEQDPEKLKQAPINTPVRRLNEVEANKNPRITWWDLNE
ncbi:aminomethyl-transferring glycine dehydrogenase subunit GcvPB [bacterium]|nr:MAG: aminomethyl-transferring glycine dehydrogenase subunit GcvPB [bacterium]